MRKDWKKKFALLIVCASAFASCQKQALAPLSYPRPPRPEILDVLDKKISSNTVTREELSLEPEDALDIIEYIYKLEVVFE